jgi:hypothetical protein
MLRETQFLAHLRKLILKSGEEGGASQCFKKLLRYFLVFKLEQDSDNDNHLILK